MAQAAALLAAQACYACYIHSQERIQLQLSPALQAALGLPADTCSLDGFLQAFSEEAAAALSDTLQTMAPDAAECSLHNLQTVQDMIFDCRATPDVTAGEKRIFLLFQDVSTHYHTERKLRQALELEQKDAARLRNLCAKAPFPAWVQDGQGMLLYANSAYAALTGMAADALPHTPEKLFARIIGGQALEEGEAVHNIVVQGERRPFRVSAVALESGLLAGFAHDAGREAELAGELKQHMAAHADLLESSGSAMAIFGSDTRLKFYNNAFAALWQLEESFLEQQPNYGRVLDELHQHRRLPEQANFQAFKQQQLKQFTDLIEAKEDLFYLPDGKVLRHLIIPHPAGGLLMAYEDITDRLALERSYNTLIAVQKATLDKLSEGVAVFGEDGRLRLSNPVYTRIWELEDNFVETRPHMSAIMEKTRHLYQEDDWEHCRIEMATLIGERRPQQLRLDLANGKTLDWSSIPLPDGATLMTYLEMTDSVKLERSLRERNQVLQEADRLKSEFLANVSYELRSPLTSIIGFTDILRAKYFGELSEKQREYIMGISDASAQLMQLINNILDIAYIEAGYISLEVGEFAIAPMLDAVSALTKERSRDMGLQLMVEYPEDIGTMLGDKKRLMQVLFNMLSNAVKFSDKGEEVHLACTLDKEHDMVVFLVEDRGIGIPREEQEQVFEKFHKGSHRGSRRSGTGLGLTMVKHIVELHGGRVELESAFGVGTKIRCTLPRQNEKLVA